MIYGLIPHLINDGLAILQYADDTIFLQDDDLEKAKKLKYELCVYEQLSGLKINFHKSEIFCLSDVDLRQQDYKEIFSCNVASLPMKNLGLHVDGKKLSNSHWAAADDKIEKRMAWKLVVYWR